MFSKPGRLQWLIASLRHPIVLPPARNAEEIVGSAPFAGFRVRSDERAPIAPSATGGARRGRTFRWICTLAIAVIAVETLRDQPPGVLAAGRQLAAGALREAGQWTVRNVKLAANQFGSEGGTAWPAMSHFGQQDETKAPKRLRSSSSLSWRGSQSSQRSRRVAMSLDPTTGSDLSNGRATVLSRRFDHAHYGSVSSAVVGSALTEPLEDDYGVRSSIGPALEHLVDFNSGFTAGDRTEFTFWPGDGVSLTSDAVRDELEGERPGEASMPVAVLESVIAESVTAPLPNAWSAELSLPAASIVPTNDEALFTVAQDSGSSLQAATAELGFSGMLPTPDRSLPEQDSSLAAGLGQSVVPSPEPSGFLLLVIGSSAMFVFQRLRKRASPASQTSMA